MPQLNGCLFSPYQFVFGSCDPVPPFLSRQEEKEASSFSGSFIEPEKSASVQAFEFWLKTMYTVSG